MHGAYIYVRNDYATGGGKNKKPETINKKITERRNVRK